MPRKDGTGPEWKWPMTGQKRGNCNKNNLSETTTWIWQGIWKKQWQWRWKWQSMGKWRGNKSN
jgi:hypothetical protein